MEPRIQYAQTKDGVNIAFWTLGGGPALLHMPSAPYNPTLRLWQTPEGRRWCERLAEQRTFIRYDNRGFGLSQRDVTDYSLDTQVLDLEAVLDHLGLERAALLGYYGSGPVALAYAVRHPERVSHLLLWCTSARGADFYGMDSYEALSELAEKNWEFFTESWAHLPFGWAESERARQYAAYLRESATPGQLRAVFQATLDIDVADLLAQVRTPTLVLQRRGITSPGLDIARGLAARIPDAHLAILEGDTIPPYAGDTDAVLQAIDEFLGKSEEAAAEAPAAPGGLVTILFTDMERSTALTQQLGDAKAQEILHAHNAIVRDALSAHSGSEIKHTGDGIMASFLTTSRALESAVAIQRAVTAHAEEHAGSPLRVRIGLNAGEPVAEEDDLFGSAVQLTRRICDDAEPGEILASDVVRQLAAGKGFLFSDRGETALRGFEDPVRLYEVRWQEP